LSSTGTTTPIDTVISPDQHSQKRLTAANCGWVPPRSNQERSASLPRRTKAPGQRVRRTGFVGPIFDQRERIQSVAAFALPAVVVMGVTVTSIGTVLARVSSMIVDRRHVPTTSQHVRWNTVSCRGSGGRVFIPRGLFHLLQFRLPSDAGTTRGRRVCTVYAGYVPISEPPKSKRFADASLNNQGTLHGQSFGRSIVTLPGVGRGAFSKHSVPIGSRSCSTP
jgi:hypothetical protein